MVKNIEDLSTPKLKRYYQRRQRSVWRRQAWIQDHSRFYPGYDDYKESLQFHRESAEAAKNELIHRGHTVI